MEPSSAGQGKWRRQSERRTPNCRSDNPAQRCPSRDDGRDEFALDSCVDRSTAISTRVRLFRLFLLIPCWESQRLIPKRSAGPRPTKIGAVSLKALDHHRPNREESAVLPLNYPPPEGRRSSVGRTYTRRASLKTLKTENAAGSHSRFTTK